MMPRNKFSLFNSKFLLCAHLQLLLYCVCGERRQEQEHGPETLEQNEKNGLNKRFVVESEYLPPIFGSFKYNPVLRQFDLPAGVYNSSTKVTQESQTTVAEVSSTAMSPATLLRGGKMDRYGGARNKITRSSINKIGVTSAPDMINSKTVFI